MIDKQPNYTRPILGLSSPDISTLADMMSDAYDQGYDLDSWMLEGGGGTLTIFHAVMVKPREQPS